MSLVIGEQVRKNSIAATILHRRHLHIVCLFTIYTYIHHPQKVFIQPLFYLFHKLQNCVIGSGWVLLLLRKDAFYYALETKYSDFQQKKSHFGYYITYGKSLFGGSVRAYSTIVIQIIQAGQ